MERKVERMDENDLQKARDLRSPHVNAIIAENERLRTVSRQLAEFRYPGFYMQYGNVTVVGVYELAKVLREHGEQKARIQQLLEAMDREVAARRKAEERHTPAEIATEINETAAEVSRLDPGATTVKLLDAAGQAQRIAALEAEVARLRGGFQIDEQPA